MKNIYSRDTIPSVTPSENGAAENIGFLGSISENDLPPSIAEDGQDGHSKDIHTDITVSTPRYDRRQFSSFFYTVIIKPPTFNRFED